MRINEIDMNSFTFPDLKVIDAIVDNIADVFCSIVIEFLFLVHLCNAKLLDCQVIFP